MTGVNIFLTQLYHGTLFKSYFFFFGGHTSEHDELIGIMYDASSSHLMVSGGGTSCLLTLKLYHYRQHHF